MPQRYAPLVLIPREVVCVYPLEVEVITSQRKYRQVSANCPDGLRSRTLTVLWNGNGVECKESLSMYQGTVQMIRAVLQICCGGAKMVV
jgi:hypothetical protein